jgi:hypothetical protein
MRTSLFAYPFGGFLNLINHISSRVQRTPYMVWARADQPLSQPFLYRQLMPHPATPATNGSNSG